MGEGCPRGGDRPIAANNTPSCDGAAAAAPMPRVLVARGAAGGEEDDKPWSSFCGFHGGRCRLRRAFQLVLKKQNKKLETWIVFFRYTFPKTSCYSGIGHHNSRTDYELQVLRKSTVKFKYSVLILISQNSIRCFKKQPF